MYIFTYVHNVIAASRPARVMLPSLTCQLGTIITSFNSQGLVIWDKMSSMVNLNPEGGNETEGSLDMEDDRVVEAQNFDTINCLICGKSFSSRFGMIESDYASEYNTMFRTFCCLLNIDCDGEQMKWNFETYPFDPFPFCSPCQQIVNNLCLLQEDLKQIQDEIRIASANITKMILFSSKVKKERGSQVSSDSVDTKINAFRCNVAKRYSAEVKLVKSPTIDSMACTSKSSTPVGTSENELNSEPINNNHNNLQGEGGTKFQCPTCDKVFVRKGALKLHSITHSAKSFICNVCGKKFARNSSLQSHISSHQSPDSSGNFSCQVCSKNFVSGRDLARHLNSHNGKISYDCPIPKCGRSFVNVTHYSDHLRSHKNKRAVWKKCKTCGKKFAFKAAYLIHQQQTHTMVEVSNTQAKEQSDIILIDLEEGSADHHPKIEWHPSNENENIDSESRSNVFLLDQQSQDHPNDPVSASLRCINGQSQESMVIEQVILGDTLDPNIITESQIVTVMPDEGNYVRVLHGDPHGEHTTEVVQIVQIL